MLKKVLVASTLALAACMNNPAVKPDIPQINGVLMENVLTRVKQEVGLFYSDGAFTEKNWPQILRDLHVNPVCGNGHIAFQIESVKMDFAVTNDETKSGSAGLKIPFGPSVAGGSIGPGVSGSFENTGNIDLVYTYKPLATGPADSDFDIIRKDAVILPALDHLRDALIKGTGQKPCFHSLTEKDPAQTLTYYVQVVPDSKSSLGFNFYVLSLSASGEIKNTSKNTITVSFRPIPFVGGFQNLMSLHEAINSGKPIPQQLLQVSP